jgi:hypothetical protein
MKTIEYLEKQYNHAFEMLKFGETKNMALIVFNGAIIVGLSKLLSEYVCDTFRCFLFISLLCVC